MCRMGFPTAVLGTARLVDHSSDGMQIGESDVCSQQILCKYEWTLLQA